jgi:hypothetical protein
MARIAENRSGGVVGDEGFRRTPRICSAAEEAKKRDTYLQARVGKPSRLTFRAPRAEEVRREASITFGGRAGERVGKFCVWVTTRD